MAQFLGTALIAFVVGIVIGGYIIPSQGPTFGGLQIRTTRYGPTFGLTIRETSSHATTRTTSSGTFTAVIGSPVSSYNPSFTLGAKAAQTCKITVIGATYIHVHFKTQKQSPIIHS